MTRTQAAALARLEPALPKGVLAWCHHSVCFGAFCGVVQAGDLTIEILPKLQGSLDDPDGTRRCLVAMLRLAGERLAATIDVADLALHQHHLLDVFILDFCRRTTTLLHRGPIRRYVDEEENLTKLRGRLHLPGQMRHNLVNQARLYCRYDEFSLDNAHNRALKHALRVMLDLAVGGAARREANVLLRRLEDVAAMKVRAEDVEALPFDRTIAPWQPLFTRAAAFLRNLHPDVAAGGAASFGLLFDMNRLFEAFVAAVAARDWGREGRRVVAQGPQRYFAAHGDASVFRMRPDIAVLDREDHVLLVADAKWKAVDAGLADLGLAQGDVYQLAAYAARYDCQQVALLYPSSPAMPAGLMRRYALKDGHGTDLLAYGLDLPALIAGERLPLPPHRPFGNRAYATKT
ncbi:MAG: hypothetical protein KDG89_06240 [Geminicoccaceae bacterium]|nr:hypothetical protein [Geminicoccaceae bacterium]